MPQSQQDIRTLQTDCYCPFCAAAVYGSRTRWTCANGHVSDGTTIVLAEWARSAVKLDDRLVEVTYTCGHNAVFARADKKPLTPRDVADLLLTACQECTNS